MAKAIYDLAFLKESNVQKDLKFNKPENISISGVVFSDFVLLTVFLNSMMPL
jgi:hypothetical protein